MFPAKLLNKYALIKSSQSVHTTVFKIMYVKASHGFPFFCVRVSFVLNNNN